MIIYGHALIHRLIACRDLAANVTILIRMRTGKILICCLLLRLLRWMNILDRARLIQ